MIFVFSLCLPENSQLRSDLATGSDLSDFRRTVLQLRDFYLPYHEGTKTWPGDTGMSMIVQALDDRGATLNTWALSLPPFQRKHKKLKTSAHIHSLFIFIHSYPFTIHSFAYLSSCIQEYIIQNIFGKFACIIICVHWISETSPLYKYEIFVVNVINTLLAKLKKNSSWILNRWCINRNNCLISWFVLSLIRHFICVCVCVREQVSMCTHACERERQACNIHINCLFLEKFILFCLWHVACRV